jgi:fluoride exporter
MIWTLAQVAVGGAIGAVLRYLTAVGAARTVGTGFPWGTLAANVIGCFLMGVIFALLMERGLMRYAPFLLAGILGGFTTFSTYSLDAFLMWERGDHAAAGVYVVITVVLSLMALLAGLVVVRGVPE